jgi:Protein of unknown function (DUF1761)
MEWIDEQPFELLGGAYRGSIDICTGWSVVQDLCSAVEEGQWLRKRAAGNPAKIFGISFLFSLIMAFNLAKFLDSPTTTAAWGATAGFLAGFGWCFMGIGIICLFERKPWSYVLINGGFLTVALTVMGLILGAWR